MLRKPFTAGPATRPKFYAQVASVYIAMISALSLVAFVSSAVKLDQYFATASFLSPFNWSVRTWIELSLVCLIVAVAEVSYRRIHALEEQLGLTVDAKWLQHATLSWRASRPVKGVSQGYIVVSHGGPRCDLKIAVTQVTGQISPPWALRWEESNSETRTVGRYDAQSLCLCEGRAGSPPQLAILTLRGPRLIETHGQPVDIYVRLTAVPGGQQSGEKQIRLAVDPDGTLRPLTLFN